MIIDKLSKPELFTSTEQHLVDFISKYPNVVINLSVDELSAQSNVSQASIIRFCKKLGAKGYSDFKVRLAKEVTDFVVGKEKISMDVPIKKGATYEEVTDTFYSLSLHALEKTKDSLDKVALTRAANMIAQADIVNIFGRGESLILAEDFQYKLMRISKHCSLEPLNGFTENVNRSTNNAKIRECALVISQYCNSTQVHYIMDELRAANIPIILLTAAKNIWPYNQYADVVLQIDCDESRNKMGCFSSRTSFLYVLDCLYGLVFDRDYELNYNNLIKSAKRKMAHNYYYTQQENEDPT